MLPIYAPLPTPAEMQLWDNCAINEFGLPEVMLMENAAREALRALEELGLVSPDVASPEGPEYRAGNEQLHALVFAGSGNNGGDGFALARHLHDRGLQVLVCHFTPLGKLKGAARKHAQMARDCGVPMHLLPKSNRPPEDFLPPRFRPAPSTNPGDLGSLGELGNPPGRYRPDNQIERNGRGLLVIDALNGTGLRGPLRQEALARVRCLNRYAADRRNFLLALDIPSGLNGLTGQPEPEAVRANATVCFEAGKPGLFMPSAMPFTGKIFVRPIGLPAAVRQKHPASFRLLCPPMRECATPEGLFPNNPGTLRKTGRPGIWPAPDVLAHKGRQGQVLVIGGSVGLAGAAHFAALGALRSGSALASVACPEGLAPEIRMGRPEIMILPLRPECADVAGRAERASGPEGSGGASGPNAPGNWREWQPFHKARLLAAVEALGRRNSSALVIGPGLGRESAALPELLSAVLALPGRPPAVLDADGLFYFTPLAGEKRLPFSLLTAEDIITPHPGEAASLLGTDPAQVQSGRLNALHTLCNLTEAVVVLKGPGTLVGQKAHDSGANVRKMRPITISPFCVGQLAVGGSGDVLAGVCATLLTRRKNNFFAQNPVSALDLASLAVHIHGRCGELIQAAFPYGGNSAADLAEKLPEALTELGI